MSFRSEHFDTSFDVGGVGTSTFQNSAARDGVSATWWRRTRGSQNSTTGYEVITWDSTKTVNIFFEPVSAGNVETPGGVVDEQRIIIACYPPLQQFDRVVFGDETYEIDVEPKPFFHRGSIHHYEHIAVKRS